VRVTLDALKAIVVSSSSIGVGRQGTGVRSNGTGGTATWRARRDGHLERLAGSRVARHCGGENTENRSGVEHG